MSNLNPNRQLGNQSSTPPRLRLKGKHLWFAAQITSICIGGALIALSLKKDATRQGGHTMSNLNLNPQLESQLPTQQGGHTVSNLNINPQLESQLPAPLRWRLEGKLGKYLWLAVQIASICIGWRPMILPYLSTLDPTLLADALWVAFWLVAVLVTRLFDRG